MASSFPAADAAPPAVARPAPGSGTPILEARGISAGYGAGLVLRGLDFAVRPGEAVGLIDDLPGAGDLVRRIAEEAEACLRRSADRITAAP